MCGELHESIPYKCECGYEETKKIITIIIKDYLLYINFRKKFLIRK